MRISDVLTSKPKGVVTLWPHHTLTDAIRLFDERNVSSVVVIDPERRPLGLITDRTAVHALARHGAGALTMGLNHLTTAPVPTCTLDTTVTQAMLRMTADRIRHLIVIHDDEMVGVVSIGDLVKVRLDDADVEGRVLREMALGRIAAAE